MLLWPLVIATGCAAAPKLACGMPCPPLLLHRSCRRVMQASFGGSVAELTGGKEYAMVAAQPLEACSPLQNDAAAVKGAIVLVQRGKDSTSCGWDGAAWSIGALAACPTLSPEAPSPLMAPSAGTCAFSEKAQAAQDAGAAGVLIYDNVLQAYFTWAGSDAVGAWLGSVEGWQACQRVRHLLALVPTLHACVKH